MAMTTGDQAEPCAEQHLSPCHDCPWRRKAIPGWLGALSVEDWIAAAHSDARVACHTRVGFYGDPRQCAGIAIYRANICKVPRDREVLRLPADRAHVFGSGEFEKHHAKKSI